MPEPLLRVHDLRTYFRTAACVARAVDGISFEIAHGETVGLVGESGCGKTVTALSLLRLVRPPGRIEPGSQIYFDGTEMTALSEPAMRGFRGARMGLVFQEPMAALNPVLSIGDHIAEVVRVHDGGSRQDARRRAIDMLATVGIASPAQRAREFPHQLSGGMRQRVVIAMALVMNPELVIADEPTTALDVTVQAQILELLSDLQRRFGTSILLITHDLGVVAEVASRVMVMYGGEVVEEATVADLFANAHHPYALGLLNAMPQVGQRRKRLATIPGTVPPPTAWPSGCRFHDRCGSAWARCAVDHPPLHQIHPGHKSRCHLAEEPERRITPHDPHAERIGP